MTDDEIRHYEAKWEKFYAETESLKRENAALTAEVDNLRHQRDAAVLKADRRQRNETSLRTRVAALEGALKEILCALDEGRK